MYDILKNLYTVSLIALLLQFAGLYEPFAVLFGLTLLYLAFADLFMQDELDRLSRMHSFAYRRRPDLTAAFVAMAGSFGILNLAQGIHMERPFCGVGPCGCKPSAPWEPFTSFSTSTCPIPHGGAAGASV